MEDLVPHLAPMLGAPQPSPEGSVGEPLWAAGRVTCPTACCPGGRGRFAFDPREMTSPAELPPHRWGLPDASPKPAPGSSWPCAGPRGWTTQRQAPVFPHQGDLTRAGSDLTLRSGVSPSSFPSLQFTQLCSSTLTAPGGPGHLLTHQAPSSTLRTPVKQNRTLGSPFCTSLAFRRMIS